MEIKITKIDNDLRNMIEEENSQDKIHNSKKSNDIKDVVEEKKNSSKNTSDKNKGDSKRFFTVNGIKYGEEVKVEVEKLEEINEYNSKGRTLDVRK